MLASGVVKRAVEQRRQEKEAVATLTSLLKETSSRPPAASGVGGAVAEKQQEEAKKELGEWREAIDASSGEVYYWNTVTREASWTLPSSSDSPSSRK